MKIFIASTHCTQTSHPMRFLIFVLLALAGASLQAQTNTIYFEDWVKSGGSSPSQTQNELLERIATVTDANGNIFVASSTFNENTQVYDLLLEKSNSSDSLVWSTQTNIVNGGDVLVGDLTLDANGAPIFTGAVLKGSNSYDALTVKFTDAGAVSWNATWNGTANGYDGGASVITDASGNVYVSGISTVNSVSRDFLTIKYTSGGTQSWAQQYDHAGLVDAAAKVTHDSGILRVFGGVQVNATTWALSYVRYNASTGAQISAGLISDNIVFNEINGFTTDADDNTYIAGARNNGSNGYDFLTLKLDSDLSLLWEATWDGTGGKDVAKAVAVDASGNVYATGYTSTNSNGRDYATLKYKPDGTFLWSKTYNGAAQGDDQATDVETDANGNVFVTGFANEKGNEDYVTIWYDGNGTEKWVGRFNNIYNRNDKSASLTIDEGGGLLVTGRTVKVENDGSETTEITTVRYERSCDYIIPPDNETQSSAVVFVKNNGQLLKTNGSPANEILYYTDSYSPVLNFQQDKINFVIAQENGTQDDYHRVDMAFNRESRSRKLFALEQRQDYFNYYLSHIQQGREFVPLYKRIIYCEAFDGVDLEISTNTSSIKYYYIIKPGASASVIRLDFNGHSGLSVVNNDLHIGTFLGDIIMPQGKAYQIDNNGNVIPLLWSPAYSITGNSVSFNIGNYDQSYYLVIEISSMTCMDDVSVNDNNDWGTFYSGSNFDKDFSDITNDVNNNIFVTGYTRDVDFPEVDGFQTVLGGDRDAFLIKFDDNAKRKFTTFYGGSSLDEAKGVETDIQGKSYIVGRTYSNQSTFPLFDNGVAYHDAINTCPSPPCYDAFIVCFNPDGTRNFSTFYGGNGGTPTNLQGVDMAFAIKKNSKGEFYIAGIGDAVLPAIGVPFEQTDGNSFIARFSPSFSPIWSSTYKASSIHAIGVDASDNLFITGFTHNNGLPVFGPLANSYVQNFGGGDNDGFIAKVTDSPIDLVWSTYYGGNQGEQFEGLAVDNNGNVLIAGFANGGSDIPTFDPSISGALYNPSPIGGTDGFFAKFDNNGVPVWGTFFGSTGFDQAWDVEVDATNNLYFVGTAGNSFTNTTQSYLNYYFQNSNLGSDGFVVNLNPQLQPLWITYYGGSDVEAAYASSISPNNKLYITGLIGIVDDPSSDFPLEDFDGNNQNESYFQCDFGNNNGSYVGGFISRFLLEVMTSSNEVQTLEKSPLILYPNPSAGFVYIQCEVDDADLSLQIFDVTGSRKLEIELSNCKARQTIDVSSLGSGIYFVKLISSKPHLNLAGKLIINK